LGFQNLVYNILINSNGCDVHVIRFMLLFW